MSYRLFEVTGVEVEYMIVDAQDLRVRPLADVLLRDAAGEIDDELDQGALCWSNELAAHVIELKTNGPTPTLEGIADAFQSDLRRIDAQLAPHGARIMPTAMHPWMDPHREKVLWPHGNAEIYQAFDAIFDCRGHGWVNLQSVHINLPFEGDEEFGRLHAAIRFLLPILPALSASSPIMDGAPTGKRDNRLDVYRTNARRVPSVSGRVIPEPVATRADYQRVIYDRIKADIEPLDPGKILKPIWTNSRGCIARFDRGAIEIRVLDTQECPAGDIAVVGTVTAAVRHLTLGDPALRARAAAFDTDRLADLFLRVVQDAENTVIDDAEYLAVLGLDARRCTARELWHHLLDATGVRAAAPSWLAPIEHILAHGTLASRILARTGPSPDRARLAEVYREICDCLRDGRLLD